MAPPEWTRQVKEFFESRVRRARAALARERGSAVDVEEHGSSHGFRSAEEEDGFEAQVSRRFKSQRSSKWDPDILAAWGGAYTTFTNEDLPVNEEKAVTIRGENYGRFFEAEAGAEREPLWSTAEGYGAAELTGEDEAPLSPGKDWNEVPVIRLRLVYFLICFAMSISSPFFVLYMKTEIGLSAGQVGLNAALQIVGGYVVGPAASLLVDRYRIHKPMWIISILMGIVPVQLITVTNSFGSALAVALSMAVLNAPISSLLDSSTLRFLGDRSHEYGKIRLWGAVGWGGGSLVAGLIVQVFGDRAAFDLFGACMLATAAVVSTLDFARLGGWDNAEGEPTFAESVSLLIPNAKYVTFLLVAIVAGFGATSLQSLLLMFLSDLGAPDFLEGLTLSLATVSELPIFYASGAIIRRYGAPTLMLASMAAFVVRSVLVSFLVNPWLVLPLQLLHGFTFAGAWTAGVAIAKQNSPPGLETSAQSLFSFAYSGVGGLSGSIVGGQLYDSLGPRLMYRIKALIFAATAMAYALTLIDWERLCGPQRKCRRRGGSLTMHPALSGYHEIR